jgi:hypothetical protein
MRTTTPEESRISETSRTTDINREGRITLTKAAFASVFDALYPNPDDSGDPHNPFGPFGPGGPVMQKWLWAMLNPQPLPPGPDPYARFSWAALNPQPLPPGPDPYRWGFLARALINRAAAQQQFVEVLGDEQSERSIIIIGGQIAEVIDDWCGTPVPGHHGPRPHALDLLAAGAQFQKAAGALSNSPLRSAFASAADKLFNAGLSRMENRSAGA